MITPKLHHTEIAEYLILGQFKLAGKNWCIKNQVNYMILLSLRSTIYK